jgi:hypothetical protein
MQFVLSEYGFMTDFDSFESAVAHCKENGLTNGEDGLLWIQSDDINELEEFMENNEINYNFMAVKLFNSEKNLMYSNVSKSWEDATEIDDDGEEDFKEMFEERKKYIEEKYGVNHGKRY